MITFSNQFDRNNKLYLCKPITIIKLKVEFEYQKNSKKTSIYKKFSNNFQNLFKFSDTFITVKGVVLRDENHFAKTIYD